MIPFLDLVAVNYFINFQADVVKSYKELEDEIQKLLVEELPKLQIKDTVQLQTKGNSVTLYFVS